MDLYNQIVAARPELSGMAVIAILEPDSHMAVYPVAADLLDDEPARPLVIESFNDLLEVRKLSKERGNPWQP